MLRKQIWEQLIDAERLIRYYGDMSRRYNRACSILRGFILLSGMTGIASLVEVLPEWVGIVAASLLCIAVVWDAMMRYEEKAAILGIVYVRFNKLRDQWRDLWYEIEDKYYEDFIQEDIRERYTNIREEMSEVMGWVPLYKISECKRINKRAEKDSDKIIEGYQHV